MKVRILEPAKHDLVDGFHFYEGQEIGAGRYFLDCLYSDIASLQMTFGIHRQPFENFYRTFSKKFPYAIFYSIRETEIWVEAHPHQPKNSKYLEARDLRRRFWVSR